MTTNNVYFCITMTYIYRSHGCDFVAVVIIPLLSLLSKIVPRCCNLFKNAFHYNDIIMSMTASQITSLTLVYSSVHSDTYQRKHQSSASRDFVWGIHRSPMISPHKGPVMRKMFPFDAVIMLTKCIRGGNVEFFIKIIWLCNKTIMWLFSQLLIYRQRRYYRINLGCCFLLCFKSQYCFKVQE